MKSLLKKTLLPLGFFLSLPVILQARELTLTASADAGIRQGNPATTYGAGEHMYVGNITGSGSSTRALLAFDLSSIPSDATITSVSLKLFVTQNDGGSTGSIDGNLTLNLHELTNSFVESSVTWNSRDSSTTGNGWSTSGGDFDTTVLASAVLPTREAIPTGGKHFSWTSDSLLSLILEKKSSGSMVYLLLKTDNETAIGRQMVMLSTKEDTRAGGSGAQLVIEYTPSEIPEPSTCALGLALGGLLVAVILRSRRLAPHPNT